MAKSFTGEQFAKALSEGKLRQPIVRVGMVKPDEVSSDAILFAPGGTCTDWIKVPVSMIESVDYLATSKCQDHEHPVAQLQFKEPAAENEAARVFAELLRGAGSAAPGLVIGGAPTDPKGATFRRNDGGIGGGTRPHSAVEGCMCFEQEFVCHPETIIVAPGVHVVAWVCEWRCKRWVGCQPTAQ